MKFLVETKIKELDIEIKTGSKNLYNIILLHILRLSLYFINENQFIKEDYFCLNDKKIYKAFYELLKNPSTEQKVKFYNDFENLDYGADIVFLICKYLNKGMEFMDINMFFRIIQENHYNYLQDLFDFPINPNRNELILNLSNFFKIKYNKAKITPSEIMELFKKKEDNISNVFMKETLKKINKEKSWDYQYEKFFVI